MIRLLSIAGVVTGVALAGVARHEPPRQPMTALGYTILAADFHVHGFPDGIWPWDTAREAQRRRLDVIALTSHNSMRGWWMWTHAPAALAGSGTVMVLPGEELTGIGYHLALVGVTRPLPWRRPAAQSAAAAHAQGGVAILAHPSRRTLEPYVTDEGLRAIDGLEVAHPAPDTSRDAREYADVYRRALALNPRVAAIGSSDFHYLKPLGLSRTYVFAREPTPDGVLDAIRAGRTAACDARGRVYGPADLTAAVADRCRADALGPPAGDTLASRAGTALAWAAALALVALGPSRT